MATERTDNVAPMQRLPSILESAHVPHDHLRGRLGIVRDHLTRRGLTLPQEHANDQHFLYTVYENYLAQTRTIRRQFPIPTATTREENEERRNTIDRVQQTALELALRSTSREIDREMRAATEPLTKAWSRGAIDNFLDNILTRYQHRYETGVLFIDIDHFKEINDTRGHGEGDLILKDLITRLKSITRISDQIGRYGGEEFVIVLPDVYTLENLMATAEDLRERIKDLGITISIGGTMIYHSDVNHDDVYDRADRALYAAKANGRDVCVAYEGESFEGLPRFGNVSTGEHYEGVPLHDEETHAPLLNSKGQPIYDYVLVS